MAYQPYRCNIFEAPCEHDVKDLSMLSRADQSALHHQLLSTEAEPKCYYVKHLPMVVPHSMAGHWSLLRQSLSSEPEPKSYRFDAKGFSAVVDVHLFEPNDISVKTIDHTIVVECNHESREDGHGPVERHFRRKFHLPMEYDMSLVTSTLSKDGILQLHASKPHFIGEEREVQVHHTEKPSLIMSLLSNRANSMLRRSHSIPSDNEED